MATLALSLAGQFAGGLFGGPIGATIGRALGALAGNAIDGLLFGESSETVGGDIRLQGSSEGGAVPRLFGWSRLSGNIIWARELELIGGENAGAKGLGRENEEEVGASFAVAFCEGEVHRLGRIWADGQILDTEGLTLRFYRGTEDQLPDGLIEATQGVAPAYRGLCYLVVEQLPLSRFGNRIPQLSVELCRVVGDLEANIRAVTVIPGATEFGYDPVPRVRITGPGATVGENTHVSRTVSDWTYSLDELTDLCPNLEHVSLVIAWFGDDLRCGTCAIGPRVEDADRSVLDVEWSVMGLLRGDVPVVSVHAGGAAYGGTPSDASVLAAIADLKARGIGVTLYPMAMMDVPADNALPDPYGEPAQAAYPWRGRITCDPAPGQPGSPDQSGTAATQVATFAAAYRQMVLHYAAIAVAAGGVDALIIGSEMRGLTTVRGAGNSFPFVSALVTLAADVRAIVGPTTKLTYAADWSEYSGYQPDGEKFFHLDPLWASPDIDAVGIDNYMPLADWRDGIGHLDADRSTSGYDLEYLLANIAGGEGYDWYYASDADRLAQVRSPITDGAHGEPWIYRFKDIRNWWSQPHHDRPGGVRSGSPTAWVPGGKPIWLTEVGCGAVDKGGNQPNIFGDDKSSESGRPYFSSGLPDQLIQRQVLRAHQAWWGDPANNPAGMLELERIYHWTWDARPYPAFPALTDVWADGVNHRCGHWLTGRLGGVASDELAVAIAAAHGVDLSAEPALPFVSGYLLGTATTAREALEPVIAVTGLSLRNPSDGLHLGAARRGWAMIVEPEELAQGEGATLSRRRGDAAEAPGRLALSYVDRERDYLTGTVTAMARADGPLTGEALGLVLDGTGARLAAERVLNGRSGQHETLELELPPALLGLEPGDLIEVAGLAEGPFEISEIRGGLARRVTARTLPVGTAIAAGGDRLMPSGGSFARSLPLVTLAHLPPVPAEPGRSRLIAGAYATPWPGGLQVVDDTTGAAVLELGRRGLLGVMATDLQPGAVAVWDRGRTIEVTLHAGHLSSAEPLGVLAGSNRLAIESDAGGWEVFGFAEATLVSPGRYRLGSLLRGLEGTGPAMGAVSIGQRVMVLDSRAAGLPVEPGLLGETRTFRVYAGNTDIEGTTVSLTTDLAVALPLPPVHLRARRAASGDVALDWVRCSRADADGWGSESPLEHVPERYRLTIFDGAIAVRTLYCAAPGAGYTSAEQAADFGAPPSSFTFTVAQLSPLLGAGHIAAGEFNG